MNVKVIFGWTCLEPGCSARGEGRGSNAASERHVRETKHVVSTWGRPA